jgi:hypothetical protein
MRLQRGRQIWRHHRAVIGWLLIGATSGGAVLAAPTALPEALQACKQEQDDNRRLACYDREVARLAAKPDDSFGLSPQQERKLQPADAQDKPKPQVLGSSVTAVIARSDGRQVIRLANGETWVQGEAWENFHVNVGDAISIKPGLLGSFYLYTPSGLATRVTRLR